MTHVALAGNIGAGKSSLTARYARHRGAVAAEEAVTENPYLADFYTDMASFGFRSQLFFLSRRYRQQLELERAGHAFIVQDRSLYEDAEVFARNLRQRGVIDDRDWSTYAELYETLAGTLRAPDLVVYLRASVPTLQERIARRGRDFEKSIAADYLAALNRLYDDWARSYGRGKLLVVDADALDFVGREADLETVLARIDAALA